ncbi:MAG: hypothetical protein P8179_06475 [Candidatus Thiodiazotropha sp.]|jgi:hypothetical protein
MDAQLFIVEHKEIAMINTVIMIFIFFLPAIIALLMLHTNRNEINAQNLQAENEAEY